MVLIVGKALKAMPWESPIWIRKQQKFISYPFRVINLFSQGFTRVSFYEIGSVKPLTDIVLFAALSSLFTFVKVSKNLFRIAQLSYSSSPWQFLLAVIGSLTSY